MLRLLPICILACLAACASAGPQADKFQPAKTVASTAATCPQSGSRLPARADQCSTPGRTFSQADVERTGQAQVGDALPLLDPSITVHH